MIFIKFESLDINFFIHYY